MILSYYDTKAGTWQTPRDAVRLIMPPLGSVSLPELHGMFDGMSAHDAYALIMAKEGTLPEKPYRVLDPDPSNPDHVVPYLADPLARGVAFRGLPGHAAGAVLAAPFGGAWPDLQAIRFVVAPASREHPGGHTATAGHDANTALPTVQHASASVTAYLEKAEQATIQISSAIEPAKALRQAGDEEKMTHWRWLASSWLPRASGRRDLLAARRQWQGEAEHQLRWLAQNGAFWWITPAHEITLVHAVQVPLLAPAITSGNPVAARKLGETSAVLSSGAFDVDGKSTSNGRKTWGW